MKIRKIIWLVGLCCMRVYASAQSSQASDCGCAQVAEDMRKYDFASAADYPTVQAQKVINDFCSLFKHPTSIYTRNYPCPGKGLIYSVICQPGRSELNYIFYDETFLGQLLTQAKWGDQFVLAHEIAHHLLGHTVRAYRSEKKQKKPNDKDPLEHIFSKKDKNQGIVSIPQRHLHELEADALGLWMLLQPKANPNLPKATRSDMQKIFDALPKVMGLYGRFDPNASNDTHPSLLVRQKLIEHHWDKYEKPGHSRRIAAIDSSNYKVVADDTEAFYAFQLLSANKEQQDEFNKTELAIRDSLNRRSRFFVDILLGGMVQRPVLHRDGEPIDATDSRSFTGGFRIGYGPWYRPHRFETDLKIGSSSFVTQAVLADGLRTIEEFNSTYLYVQPRYVYSRMNRLAKSAYRTTGLMATVGASVSIPIRYAYTNHVAPTYQGVPQRTGLAPVVGIGYGRSNWLSSNGHFRLWLLYQPQPLCLATESAEKVSAWLHTASLDLSFRFW